jgi:hypothetical protein
LEENNYPKILKTIKQQKLIIKHKKIWFKILKPIFKLRVQKKKEKKKNTLITQICFSKN